MTKIKLECSYEIIDGGINGSKRYECHVNKGSVTDITNNQRVYFEGEHLRGKENQDVDVLFVNPAERSLLLIYDFPRELEIFSNLKAFHLVDCGLKRINSKDLIGLKSLELLDVCDNNLTLLPYDLFINTKKLKRIHFKNNKISSMSSRILDPIPDTQWELIDFRENAKIDAIFLSAVSGTQSCKNVRELKSVIDMSCSSSLITTKVADNGFKRLWESKKFCDFTIIAVSKEIHVHRIVLAAQSSVLSDILDNDNQVKLTNKLEIQECGETAVEDFFRTLYTGEIRDEQNALEIFSLACTFKVGDLVEVYEGMVKRYVNEKNALTALKVGNIHASEKLINEAFSHLKKLYPNDIQSETLKHKPFLIEKIVKKINAIREMKDEIEAMNHD